MNKIEDLSGRRFGRLTVLFRSKNDFRRRATWACRCDCGRLVSKQGTQLKRDQTHSCGCLRLEIQKEYNTIHGGCKTRLYNIWAGMKSRCFYQKNNRWQYYGGRGIKVCDAWVKSFSKFRDWALSKGYSDNLTIDRINVNGDYCPENCRWVTYKEQANNRRKPEIKKEFDSVIAR